MQFSEIRDALPAYAKDVWITLDGALHRSELSGDVAAGAAVAAAISAGSKELVEAFEGLMTSGPEATAAKTAAAIMGMTNIWYSYLDLAEDADLKTQPPGIRMQSYV